MSVTNRGLYGQVESSAAASNAIMEHDADNEALYPNAAPVGEYVDRMADHVDDYRKAIRQDDKAQRAHVKAVPGSYGKSLSAKAVALAALTAEVQIYGEMIHKGFSKGNAIAAINQAEARAYARTAYAKGKAAPELPAIPTGTSRSQPQLYQNAARNGERRYHGGREADLPAETWQATAHNDSNAGYYAKDIDDTILNRPIADDCDTDCDMADEFV